MEKLLSFLKKLLIVAGIALAAFLAGRYFLFKEYRMPEKVEGVGNFSRTFNDMQDKQLDVATAYGVEPVKDRAEAEKMTKELVELKDNKLYVLDRLDYSIPYLTKPAAKCLDGIAEAFRDSLKTKRYPKCKLVVTSVLRTQEDVEKLRKKNINATANSCHLYGTTFDISWKSFVAYRKKQPDEKTMKLILSEVLRDQREEGNCYVKYEQKEGCFHITSRIPSKF